MSRSDADSTPSIEIISAHSAQNLLPFASEGPGAGRLKLAFSTRRRRSGPIDFSFLLTGSRASDLDRVVLPEFRDPRERVRRHELWKNTCLEIFIAPAHSQTYYELNLSPSGDWNLYAFDSYRSGMREADHSASPLLKCEWSTDRDSVVWHGSLARGGGSATGELDRLLAEASLVMGATAVIEYRGGEREYWALAHAGEKPDFHLRQSFRLVL